MIQKGSSFTNNKMDLFNRRYIQLLYRAHLFFLHDVHTRKESADHGDQHYQYARHHEEL